MKLERLACVAVVTGCLALARPASAQSADPPASPPAAPASVTEPAPAAPAPDAQPAAPQSAAPAPGRVRLHVRTLREKTPHTARVFIKGPGDTYSLVCATPCSAEVPAGAEMRVTFDDHDDEPHAFVLSPELGSEVEIEVRPASKAPLIGGIVMMGSGGLLAALGALYVAMADKLGKPQGNNSFFQVDTSDAYRKAGYIVIGIGAAVSTVGLIWFLTRSHEPRLVETPLRAPPRPQAYGRSETLASDVASGKRRDEASLGPAPFTPVQWGFTF